MDKGKLKKFFTKKRIIIAAAAVAVIAIGSSMLGGGDDNSGGMMVSAVGLEQKNLKQSVTLKAPLEGTETGEIVSNLHYKVEQLLVQEGDKVTKGQVLAILDSEAMADEIQAAQDALELAQCEYDDSLRNSQAAYEQAVQTLNTTQRKYDQTKALYEVGGIAAEEWEQVQSDLRAAQAAVDLYNVKDGQVQGNSSTLKNIEVARNTLTRKKEALADGQITSPINGTVTRVNIEIGRFADETDDKKPMFVVENLEKLQMKVSVSEYDIDKIAVGQPVTISADLLNGETVEGVVSRISPTGEQKSMDSTERIIPIVIDVTGQNEKLIAGINAKAEILTGEAPGAFAVPMEAILDNGDGTSSVVRVKDGIVETVPVTLGLENDLEVQIISDMLQAGDQIIVNPAGLVDGTKVVVNLV